MVERRIYAHWLDPDYLGRFVVPGDELEKRVHQFGGFLKMHAIAGDCMHISGVQLIESRLLLKSFADLGFQQFMSNHPDFLRLVEQPNDRLGAKSTRLAQICGGLARLESYMRHGGGYIPNTYTSAELIPSVADLFKGIEHENHAEILFGPNGKFKRLVEDYSRVQPQDRDLADGLYFALKHFLLDSRAPVLEWNQNQAVSYYSDELEIALDYLSTARKGNTPDAVAMKSAKDLIETREERFRRSPILRKLSHTSEVGHPDRLKYLIIAQAWNVAAGRVMQANCHSAYCFRGIPTVPVYSGLKTGRVSLNAGPGEQDLHSVCIGQEDEIFKDIIRYAWHPADLQWEIISEVRSACTQDLSSYQHALEDAGASLPEDGAENAEKKFARYTEVAARVIAKDQPPLQSERDWVNPTCTLAASVLSGAAAFVSVAFALPGATLEAGAGFGLASLSTFQLIRQALLHRDAQTISKMLQQYGQQYNLHRSG